jgi:hypothetical protein
MAWMICSSSEALPESYYGCFQNHSILGQPRLEISCFATTSNEMLTSISSLSEGGTLLMKVEQINSQSL